MSQEVIGIPRAATETPPGYFYVSYSEQLKRRIARGVTAVAIGGLAVVGADCVAQLIASEHYSSASTALMSIAEGCQPNLPGSYGTVITQLPEECTLMAPYLQQTPDESAASDIALGLPAGTVTYRVDDRLADTVSLAMGYAQTQQEQDAQATGHAWGASALLVMAGAGAAVSIRRRTSES